MAWSALKEPSERQNVRNNKLKQQVGPPPPCTLLFLDAAQNFPEGTEHKLVASKIILGRGSDCTICYGDDFPMVSRAHASIEWANNNYYLRHLSETNQTLLNGRPINRKWFLQENDVIQLAPSGPKIRFKVAEEESLFVEPVKKEDRKIDIYKISWIIVVLISAGLLGWLLYMMMLDA